MYGTVIPARVLTLFKASRAVHPKSAASFPSPEAIFLFGGLSKAGKLIFEPTQWYMEENMLFVFKNKVKLLPSGIQGKNAAILGASALIWQQENK